MALTRADKYTELQKKQEIYSDFGTSFGTHPLTNRLIRLTNENSVKQGLKNRILTNLGERPFNPNFGSRVRDSLFEPATPFTIADIERSVSDAVAKMSSRVRIHSIDVLDDLSKNGYSINIVFSLLNDPTPISFSFLLKKVR